MFQRLRRNAMARKRTERRSDGTTKGYFRRSRGGQMVFVHQYATPQRRR